MLSKRALDLLNRSTDIKSEIEFCGEGGGLANEMPHFMGWLGEYLRSKLQRENWEDPVIDVLEDGVVLYLSSPRWQLRAVDDYVAFAFWWPDPLSGEPPSVELYVPAQDLFGPRNELANRLRPKLKRSGFTDRYEQDDPDPSCPLWKNIPLDDFHKESGFDLDSFVTAVVDAFQRLMEIEPLIDAAFDSLAVKALPLPAERCLKTIAFVDTEYEGSEPARKMTELAIINVAYDPAEDAVVGILEEYSKKAGQPLDTTKAHSLMERADVIVAHNAFGADKPLVARELPGTERMKWLCSFRGLDWKQLIGVQSESLETLMGKTGLRYEQDHRAHADARDLKDLLAVKHKGRTYLGRLLDNSTAAATGAASV